MSASISDAQERSGWTDVGEPGDFVDGEFTILELNGGSVGVIRTNDQRWYAVRNVCPHRQAPICMGSVSGTYLPSEPGEFVWGMQDRVLRCPWHSYEFDIESGEPLFVPGIRERLVRYDVEVVDGRVRVSTRAKRSAG
jgi:nitrite reductase/ring-hydroxylating ferredoxin subunit